jgi:Pyruvate/2-oxoacid:ferredoxin oxidoreductase delta subunit/flavodoxin
LTPGGGRIPRCLIVYLSLAGSTAKVARAIAEGLAGGYDVSLHNLAEGAPPATDGFDLLGFGSPVFNYTLPFNVVDLIRSLPPLDGRPTFLFNTYGTYRFDIGAQFAQIARARGASVLGHFACPGWDSFLGYAKVGWLFSGTHPDQTDLAEAEEFGRDVTAKAGGRSNTNLKPSRVTSPPLIYRLERLCTSRWLTSRFYSRFFKVDRDKCKKCRTCARQCPTSNIGTGSSGFPVWHQHCIGCLMCELRCPQDAIRSPIADWAIFRPFLRYNVRKAARDETLGGRAARHFKGNIELI